MHYYACITLLIIKVGANSSLKQENAHEVAIIATAGNNDIVKLWVY